jgi:hypothetical protein
MRHQVAKTYAAEAAITPRRIVKHGAADGGVINSAAAADKHAGVADSRGAAAAGDAVDIYKSGTVEVEYGGNVTRGDPLTSDAVGRAITAAPAAGANVRIVGFAEVSGVLGDIGEVDLKPSVMQG